MPESEPDLRGPVDFVLVELEGDKLTDLGADELLARVDTGIVGVYDIQVIGKSVDGSAYRVVVTGTAPELGDFARMAWRVIGLSTDEDVDDAADAMEPGTLAVLVVYENFWPVPFITASWTAGGRLVASARLAADDLTSSSDARDVCAK